MPYGSVVDAVGSAAGSVCRIVCVKLLHRKALLCTQAGKVCVDLSPRSCGARDDPEIKQVIYQSNPAAATGRAARRLLVAVVDQSVRLAVRQQRFV